MAEAVRLRLMISSGAATERCECPTCGRVFSTDGNFRRHLTPGRLLEGYDGPWCRDPATVGMVQHERGWWLEPAPEGPLPVRRGLSDASGAASRGTVP